MSKHTPGPWRVYGTQTLYIEAFVRPGWLQEVAAVGPTEADSGYGEQQKANARLIASAPLMYEFVASAAANGDNEAMSIMEAINGRS